MKILKRRENHLINNKENFTIKICPNCGSVLDILRSDCDLERTLFGNAFTKCPVCDCYLTIHHEEWKSRDREK